MNFTGTEDVSFTNGASPVTLTNNQTITVANHTLSIAGAVIGDHTLTKAGDGTLSLGGGSWSGLTTVTGGTLEVLAKTVDAPYVVNSGTTLKLGYTTGEAYAPTNIKVYGDGLAATTGLYFKGGASYNSSGTIQLLAAPTTIRQYGSGLASIGTFDNNGTGLSTVAESSGSTIDSNIQFISRGYGMSVAVAVGSATTTGDLVINGPLNVGSGGFFKRGAGSLALNGTASPGNLGVNIQGGSIICGVPECLGANAALQISTGAKLDVNGNHQTVASLSFDNVPQANGTWGSEDSTAENKNNTYFSGTGVVQVGAASGGFAEWAATNAPGQTIGQDHDGDGVSNGIEYFMGLNGSGFTANPGIVGGKVSWTKGGAYSGTYGADYTVQTSPDLSDWTDVPASDPNLSNSSPLQYTLPTGAPKSFVRLNVTGP